MRPSEHDIFIVIISLIIFVYSFCFIEVEEITKEDMIQTYLESGRPPPSGLLALNDGEVVARQYPTAILITPVICFMFLFFIIFKKELMPVNHHFVIRYYYIFKKKAQKKLQEGIQEYREYKRLRK